MYLPIHQRIRLFVALIALLSLTTGVASAQDDPEDKKTYVLVQAAIRPADPLGGRIEVIFGESMPEEYTKAADDPALTRTLPSGTVVTRISREMDAGKWKVRATRLVAGNGEMVGHTVWLRPSSVRRAGSPGQRIIILDFNGTPEMDTTTTPPAPTGRFIVAGQPADRLDPTKHQLTIRFNQDNFPSVVVGEPLKKGVKKAFTAAKGAKDADVYINGAITAGEGSKPNYSLEARLAYLQSLKQYGAIGPQIELATKEENNFDPDSIRAGLAYENVKSFRSGAGIIFRANTIGFEFNRKNTVHNLVTGLDGILVLPSVPVGEKIFATMDFTMGFEAGNNYRNKLRENGIGAFWRPKFGAAAYLLALDTPVFDRISFNANYEVRLPRSAEIYSEMQGEEEVFSLTRKPRHRFGADLNFLFNPAYGLSLQYRYGTLPPSFKMEKPNVKLGFVVQLKQANK